MLPFRKILLCDFFYLGILFFAIFLTVFRLELPRNSLYTTESTTFTGKIIRQQRTDEVLTLYIKKKETVIGTIYLKNGKEELFQLGDIVTIKGEFREPEKNTTRYLFNYQFYCYQKNIFYLVKVDTIEKQRTNKNIYYFVKQKVENHLNQNPYLYTFLLGDKSYLSDEVKRSYQENGISHLFAISGMHISLLGGMIEKILKRRKIREEKTFKITSVLLLSYLGLVGFSPSVLRGVLFYILFSWNRIYYFYIKPHNLFILILSIALLWNPNFLFDVGFQYSYAISFSLIQFSDILKSKHYVGSLLKVSLLSFFTSIPITLYHFYQLNLSGIFYNLIFVPLISFLIFPFSILVFFLPPLEPIYNTFILGMEQLSLFLGKISYGKFLFQRLPIGVYLLYGVLIFGYLVCRKKIIFLLFVFLLNVHYWIPSFDKTDYLKMIDVGQGDSILLHSDNKNILVDTGGVSYGQEDGTIFYHTLLPLLRSEGIKKIDYLILTHGDKDHLGEAKTLLENMSVETILINSNQQNNYEKELLLKNTIIGEEGLSFQLKDFYLIQLNENLGDENDSSQIYFVQYQDFKILLTGDASIKSEERLLQKYELGKINILKVGHHGSKTSTSEKLLEEIRPDIALISSGRENKFHHPHEETIEKLKKYQVKVYNTQECGTITYYFQTRTIKTDA